MADRVTTVTLLAKVGSFVAETERARNAVGKVGDEAAKTAAKLREQHDAMREVGAGVAAVGAIAAVAFGLAVAKFAEFDQAMSNVKAATQETSENMGLLRDAALEAGASTVFSATEAANAIEELGKAGLSTEQILGGGLKGALDLAAAGQLSVAEAAGIAAIAMKQFNLDGKDLPHIADLLAAGAGKAVGDVEDLAAALGQVGLIANGAGQSIEDTTGVLAAFADAGLLGSDAGTSLKTAIVALTAPTDKARAVMDEYKLSFFDANGEMLSFDKIAGVLADGKLKSLTEETRNAALAQIFGTDALRVANVLYEQGADKIKGYIDQTNDSGYAAKVAADRLNNLTGDVEKLGGAIDTALIKSGSGVNDMLRALTQGATGIVDALGNLPGPVLGVVGGLTGLVAVVGLVGGATLLAVPKIVQFKLALSSLNISGASAARGIGLASGALVIATAAFAIWAAKQAEATSIAAEFQDSLDKSSGAITDYTRELVQKKLAESSAFDGAKNAGISQKELTDAILEGGDAVEVLRQRLYDYANGNPFDPAIANTVNAVNDLSGGLERADKNFDDVAAASAGSAEKTTDAATAYQEAADKAGELEDNLRTLIDTINESNELGSNVIQTNAAYQSALAGITDEVDKQKEAFIQLQRDAYEEANGSLDGFVGTLDGFTLSLDHNTEAGSANEAMLDDVASKARASADAQFDLDLKTMSAQDATEKYMGTLADQRQAFIDSATEAGFNADAVKILADNIFAMPSEKEVDLIVDAAAAQAVIDNFVWSNDGRRINLIVDGVSGRQVAGSNIDIARASGGIIPGAPSHTDNMIAAVASGEYVVNTRQTQKNLGALEYINRGGVIRGYADGGMVRPQYATNLPRFAGSGNGGSSAPLVGEMTVMAAPGTDVPYLAREVVERIAFAQRGN